MIKKAKIDKKGKVPMPETFLITMADIGMRDVNIHFGGNNKVVLITAKDIELNKDNTERLRILMDLK